MFFDLRAERDREREREIERAFYPTYDAHPKRPAPLDHHRHHPATHTQHAKGVDRHSRPEPLYFWFYFVVVNGIWIVVPIVCIVAAARRINAAVARAEGGGGGKAARAKAK